MTAEKIVTSHSDTLKLQAVMEKMTILTGQVFRMSTKCTRKTIMLLHGVSYQNHTGKKGQKNERYNQQTGGD